MPKIIGGSLHEHREQTRLKLFTALSTLMAERGFDAITLSDIANAAGVGRTAVYNHFADKEALLVGFIMHETQQYIAELEAEIADVDDPVDQLRAYIRTQAALKLEYHLAPGPELRSVLSRDTQMRVREHVMLLGEVLRGILAAGIAQGSFPEQDLNTSVTLVNACLASRNLPEDGPARDRAVEATVDFVLRAVGADVTGGTGGTAEVGGTEGAAGIDTPAPTPAPAHRAERSVSAGV